MDWEIDYLKENGIVQVKTSGQLTWEENKKLNAETLATGRKQGVGRFLVDHHNVDFNLCVLQIDNLPKMFRNIGFGLEDKMAILYNPSGQQAGLFKFLQNVFFLNSLPVRVFADATEAMFWLKSGW